MSSLVELLAGHVAHDEKERADVAAMLGFAASLLEPYSRTQWPAHFTGSAVVVDEAGARVCLLLHAKLNRWLQPGGHAEPADSGSMEQTALREAVEETGLQVALVSARPIDVDVHVIPARKSEPEHRHLDVRYLVRAVDSSALQHDPSESHGAQWLSWEDALARADEPALRRLLEKARALAQR